MSGTDPTVTEIAETHRAFVYALAIRFAPWPGLADDITQQVFLEFIGKAGQWDLQRDVRPLLAGMTRNVAMRAWREHTRSLPEQLQDLAEHIRQLAEQREATADNAEELSALKRCLQKLPEKSKHLLDLYYYLDVPSVDIARQMQMNADAVRRALFRLREQLRRCIRGILKEETV